MSRISRGQSGQGTTTRSPSTEYVKDRFRDLFNRMRVSTEPDEVKSLVSSGQELVDESHGSAKKLARKRQDKLSKAGEKKLGKILVEEKGKNIGAGLHGAGGEFRSYEKRSPPSENRRGRIWPGRKRERMK